MPQKTFFIATPYGDKAGSQEDQAIHALTTGLRTNVIDAAIERCRSLEYDISAFLSSDKATGKNIWEKVGIELSSADGVIGVIAGDKPSTFIEIGLAFGLWYTPILLHFVEYDLPADLEGSEVGKFTRAQALGIEDASAVIDWLVLRMINEPPRYNRDVPAYLPDTTSSSGRVRTYDRFSKAIDAPQWSDMLWDAEREIVLAGPKLYKLFGQVWSGRPDADGYRAEPSITFEQLLVEKCVKDSVDIIAVMPHPAMVTERDLKRPLSEDSLEDFKVDLERGWRKWNTAAKMIAKGAEAFPEANQKARIGRVQLVRTQKSHFPHRLTMTDKRMLLTLRFYGEDINSRFCIDAGPQFAADAYVAPIYTLIRSDIDLIVRENGDDPSDGLPATVLQQRQ